MLKAEARAGLKEASEDTSRAHFRDVAKAFYNKTQEMQE